MRIGAWVHTRRHATSLLASQSSPANQPGRQPACLLAHLSACLLLAALPTGLPISKLARRVGYMRGWRNTVEIVLFDISNSMKPYPRVFYYNGKLKSVICSFEPQQFEEVSTVFRPKLSFIGCELERRRSSPCHGGSGGNARRGQGAR